MQKIDLKNLNELAVKIINEHSDENHNNYEYDPEEVHMARSELESLCRQSQEVFNLIAHLPSLEGWVASKITKAADYISSVHDWLKYEIHHGTDEHAIEKRDENI